MWMDRMIVDHSLGWDCSHLVFSVIELGFEHLYCSK